MEGQLIMVNTVDIIRENLQLKQKIANIESLLKQSTDKYNDLLKEYNKLLILPKGKFTLSQFIASYLTMEFNETTMPKSGGIYAYLNTKNDQLYIGQSVNMNKRLKQHFRNGKIKVDGHDSEFNDLGEWKFYVLEFIDRNNKSKLNDREAYWIAIGKDAVSNKDIVNLNEAKVFQKKLKSKQAISDIVLKKTIHQEGELTNRTRGNNIKM